MNDTIELLHARASCRAFADRPIPAEVLESVLEAGVRAPTGGNLQPYSIIAVRDRAVASTLASLCGDQSFIARAPVNLLFCIDFHRGRRWAELCDAPFTCNRAFRHFWIAFQDTVIAAQNICVAADSAGLGSCYVGTVLECFPELRAMFRLPQGVFPVVLLSLGYPAAELRRRGKFPQSIIVHGEVYDDPSDERLAAGLEAKYQGKTFEATESRIAELAKVCTAVGGPELASRCVERVRRDGTINMAQYYFGLHYPADMMPKGNSKYVAQMRDAGIEIIEDGE